MKLVEGSHFLVRGIRTDDLQLNPPEDKYCKGEIGRKTEFNIR